MCMLIYISIDKVYYLSLMQMSSISKGQPESVVPKVVVVGSVPQT